MLEKNINDKIIDIFKESFPKERLPKIKERASFEIVGGKTILVEIPKRSKLHYHSSSYNIECNEMKKNCRIEGNLLIDLHQENEPKKSLQDLTCDIYDIHHWDGKSVKSTHIHFGCTESYDDILKVIRVLAKY